MARRTADEGWRRFAGHDIVSRAPQLSILPPSMRQQLGLVFVVLAIVVSALQLWALFTEPRPAWVPRSSILPVVLVVAGIALRRRGRNIPQVRP